MGPWLDGAAKLLSAGPLGLGALVVLVTGSILITGNAVEKGRLKLALSMLVSGFLLVIAGLGVLIFQTEATKAAADAAFAKANAATAHIIYFRVEPLALGSTPNLPAPVIKINEDVLKGTSYTLNSDVTAIIDVTDAINKVSGGAKNPTPNPDVDVESIKKNREQLAADLDTTIAQVQRIAQLMNQSCSGGAHGINPFHYDDVLSLSNSITTALEASKAVVLNGKY